MVDRRDIVSRAWDGVRREQVWGLSLLVAIVALPIAWAIGYAALYSVGAIGLLSDGVTWRHWSAVLSSHVLSETIGYSMVIAGISTGLAVSAALVFVLSYPRWRLSRWRMSLLVVPLATPAAVVALVTYQVLNPGGLLARFVFALGWIKSPSDFPPLVNDPWSIGLVTAQTATSFPLLVLFLLKSWTSGQIDRYCGLAESLGASLWEARRQVALPMLVSRLRPLILFTFLVNLGAYELPLVLGRQAPQMFSVLTQRRFGLFDLAQRPQAFVLALIYLVLVSLGAMVLVIARRPAR